MFAFLIEYSLKIFLLADLAFYTDIFIRAHTHKHLTRIHMHYI